MANTKKRRPRRQFDRDPDDPGRNPYRIVDLWKLRDLYVSLRADGREPHQGSLLKRSTYHRAARDPKARPMGKSVWAHSAQQAVGYCLRRLQGVADWPAGRYLAVPYEEWLEEVAAPRIRCVPGFPPAPTGPQEPPPREQLPVPVPAPANEPPTLPFPEEAPTLPIRTPLRPKRDAPHGQLTLPF